MTHDEIYEHIVGILVETFEIEPSEVTPESDMYGDLGLDSIDAIDIFVQLREVTQRRPIPDEARVIRTVGELVAYVEKELAIGPGSVETGPAPDPRRQS